MLYRVYFKALVNFSAQFMDQLSSGLHLGQMSNRHFMSSRKSLWMIPAMVASASGLFGQFAHKHMLTGLDGEITCLLKSV